MSDIYEQWEENATGPGREKRIQDLESQIKKNPRDMEPYPELIYQFMRLGRVDQALSYAQKRVDIEPMSAQAHDDLAKTLMFSNRPEDARKHFETAVSIDPASVTYSAYIMSAVLMEDFESGVRIYESISDCEHDDIDVYGNAANCYARLGRTDEAIEILKRALNQKSDPFLHANLATIYCMCDKFDKARSHIEIAYAAYPDDETIKENYYYVMQALRITGSDADNNRFDPRRN